MAGSLSTVCMLAGCILAETIDIGTVWLTTPGGRFALLRLLASPVVGKRHNLSGE